MDTLSTRADHRPQAGPSSSHRPAPRPLAVLTARAVTAPGGDESKDVTAAVLAGRSQVRTVPPEVAGPFSRACVIPDFDRVAALGRKGTRTMDRASALAVATLGRLGPSVIGPDSPDPDGIATGIVLGTTMGSVQSTMDFTRDGLTGDRPYLVDPARFPNTVMNFAAGQCAIWHGLRGPNATVAAGRVTGLLALRYAIRMLQLGHASRVIAGAVEEMSPQRAWLEWHTAEDPDAVLLGEGCGVFVVEAKPRQDHPEVASILALSTGIATEPDRRQPVLVRCIREVLARLEPDAVIDVVAPFDAGPGSDETAAVAAVLPPAAARPEVLDTTGVLGDSGAASASLQALVAVGALTELSPRRSGYALVTSVDAEGIVGALVLVAPEERR